MPQIKYVLFLWHGPNASGKRTGVAASVACELARVARARQARPKHTYVNKWLKTYSLDEGTRNQRVSMVTWKQQPAKQHGMNPSACRNVGTPTASLNKHAPFIAAHSLLARLNCKHEPMHRSSVNSNTTLSPSFTLPLSANQFAFLHIPVHALLKGSCAYQYTF